MDKTNRISGLSKGLLVLGAILLSANLFLPIWKIELFAPQYPEGLILLIYADRLAGSVDIINGLNHYIGMQTLHTENFIEFSILRYIFIFFCVLILLTAVIGRKKGLYALFIAFLFFSILSMVDFYRWNYDYGHHLDPNAAIKVPGMTYQPPLIGFKQLLNFGAYSVPAIGGIMFILSGVLLLIAVLNEKNIFSKWFKRKSAVPIMLILAGISGLSSCSDPGPRPIKVNGEDCAYCKMTITDAQFAAQLTTTKGRQYVFDDLICMVGFKKENPAMDYAHFYLADFTEPGHFIDLDQAILMQSDSLRSPMGGNMGGFAVSDSARIYKSRFGAGEVSWADLIR